MTTTSRGRAAARPRPGRTRKAVAATALAATALAGVTAAVPAAAQTTGPFLCTAATNGAANAFSDVTATSAHKAAIDCLVFHGVSNGRTATSYGPDHHLTRAQAASLLFRVTELAGKGWQASADHFDDDDGSVHETAINALAANGVIRGVGERRFDPHAPITRAQAATLAVRSFEMLIKAPLPAGADAFDDDTGNSHEADINKAAAAGILSGTGPRRYEPNRPLRRDESASVMARAVEAMARAFLGVS